MFTATDHALMTRALQLAEQGLYTTMPNPRVGCVIARDGQIVGEGAHLKAGEPHAEVFALRQAGELAKGATAYVTLEPCSHHGRTPPCADALVQAGVSQVVAAMQDPNPLVSGNGLAYLNQHGISTQVGLMQAQAEALNPGFIARMRQGRPFVRSKIAASLDGKTALNNGESKWITSEAARRDVQHWRARSCAILTGVGTILRDDPALTVRDISLERQPLRIVVDSYLRTPLSAQILQEGRTMLAFAYDAEDRADRLFSAGAELLCVPDAHGKVCLDSLIRHLGANEISELMVEAGAHLNGALITQHLVDEYLIYYAAKVMGGDAKEMFSTPPFTTMTQAIDFQLTEVRQFGNDLRIRAIPHYAD
jgi:diaminohydroxyphosphoribosylaminopyrimidine deaminase / 5-amino-6-(5-phosphoribosylamino)uracil reductase